MLKKFLVCLVLLSFPLVFAVTNNDVGVSLVTSGDDTWTNSSTEETFNFTIENQNSSYSFDRINITLPNAFSFSEQLSNNLATSWSCSKQPGEISCNTTTYPLNEHSINIWFNATSEDCNDEKNVTWIVDLDEILEINITSGIDGKPPQVNEINMTYNGSTLEDGGNITERKNITLTVNVTDGGIGVDKVLASVYNSSNVINTIELSQADSNFIGDIDTSSLMSDNYIIQIEANDSLDNLNNSESVSFKIIDPDFKVVNFTWNPTNPYPRENLTVFANITNSGEVDYSGDVTLRWSDGTENYNQTISNLLVGNYIEVNYTYENFDGQKNISLRIDPENSITELSEDNNYHLQTISTDLNVAILDVDPSHLEHDGNLILNVSVKYWNNNTNVTDLSLNNFEIYDQWISNSSNYRNNSIRISDVDTTLNSYGIYLVNYTVPEISGEILEYGEHNVKVGINKVNYFTNSSNTEYFMDGPDLTISYSGYGIDGYDLDDRDNATFSITVTNNGNKAIYGVNLTIRTTEGDITEDDECNSANQNITPGDPVILCENVVIKSTQDFTLTSVATGTYNSDTIEYEYNNYNVYVGSKDTSPDSEDDDPDEEWKDDSPSSDGGAVTTTAVEKKYLSITEYPEKVEIEQGKRIAKTVVVKNEDDWEFQDVTLKIDEIESSWVTVTPGGEVEIEPFKIKQYQVVFEIPEDAEIKDYSGEFQVSSSFETKKQSFTLSVLPGPELQVTINSTIEDYQNQIQELEDEIDSMKNKGYNTTEVDQKLKELKDEFNKLLAYRDGGNYKSAYGLLDNTGNLLNQTTSILSGAVVLPTVLFGVVESKWVLSGLFGVLFIVGAYTFWGRHYDIKKRILKKLKRKTKTNSREKDLENIIKGIRGEELRTLGKIEKATEAKPKTSDRMKELELIKNLATSE